MVEVSHLLVSSLVVADHKLHELLLVALQLCLVGLASQYGSGLRLDLAGVCVLEASDLERWLSLSLGSFRLLVLALGLTLFAELLAGTHLVVGAVLRPEVVEFLLRTGPEAEHSVVLGELVGQQVLLEVLAESNAAQDEVAGLLLV